MKRRNSKNTCEDYSISKVLRNQNKSNDYFEILLSSLSLEEIIALKLELAYKAIGFPLHGFPIWKSINYITKDALLKYAVSASKTKSDAMRLLGLDSIKFFRLLKKYNINKYYIKEENNDQDN
jgi:transcriptional regulator of acetoin/glycerol metabolism